MKISTLWYGGYSYSSPLPDDIEYFNSIKEAKDIFYSRYHNRWNFKDGNISTPCVSDNTNMWIAKGIVENIEYPDIILTISKKGEIIKKRA